MITVISFLFFYLFIYFLGRGFTSLDKIKLKELYEIPINIIYPDNWIFLYLKYYSFN